MMLGRTIVLAGSDGDVSFVKPRWYTRVFVGADVGTLVIQGLGMFFWVLREKDERKGFVFFLLFLG